MSSILSFSLDFICMFAVSGLVTSQQPTAAHSLQSSKVSSSTSKYFAAFFCYFRTDQRVTKRIQGCCQTFAIVNTVTVFMHTMGTRATLLLLVFNGTLYQRMLTKTGSTCLAWKTLVEAILLGRGQATRMVLLRCLCTVMTTQIF